MNQHLELYSIVRKKKASYRKGKAHAVHENKRKQDFTAPERNKKWCTDFTYLFLTDGSKRYNCSIIDLHNRAVIASLNSNKMDSKKGIDFMAGNTANISIRMDAELKSQANQLFADLKE